MIEEQLYISNLYVPLKEGLNPSITRSIVDVREPNKRKSTYSKTATVPDSVEARQVFGQIFDVNLTNGSFNPTIKADCIYKVGGNDIINGYCQLTKITITDDKEISYDIVMYGEIASIFNEIKDEYLEDLYSFSDTVNELARWDHPWDKSVIEDSWATQVWDASVPGYIPFAVGTGYVYPLIDFGYSQDATTFQMDWMAPAIYVKEYWDAIFAKAGFSYTSTFINSDLFKRLIIPSSPEIYLLDSTDIANREFEADTPQFTSNSSATSGNLTLEDYGSNDVLIFTNEVTDPGGIYDNTTGKWTVVNGGWYSITTKVQVNATFDPVGPIVKCTSEVRGRLKILLNSGTLDETSFFITRDNPAYTNDWPYTTDPNPTYPDSDYLLDPIYVTVPFPLPPPTATARPVTPPDEYTLVTGPVYLAPGDEIEVAISAGFFKGTSPDYFEDLVGGSSPGDATISISGSFENTLENAAMSPGSTLTTDKIIPKNIKQDDFLLSLVKAFNLYLDPDPDDPKNLIVEPREDYLGSTKVDIQKKIALDKGIDIIPVGAMDANRYIYRYKPDKDYYNTQYETEFQQTYGERLVTATNEFAQKDETTELLFSPTPVVGLPNNDRIIPTIIEVDDLNQPKSTKHNIRLLYYGGLKNNSQAWLFQKVIGNTVYTQSYETQYPYAGHWDDPFTPTLDINFGLVKRVYYDFYLTPITYTNNNLWNVYHSKMISEITDPDSKIVHCHVNITPSDFKSWSFKDLYWFNNAYHRLHKIINYNPTGGELTKCEFLKLKSVPAFSPTTGNTDNSAPPVPALPATNLDTDEQAPTTKNLFQGDGNSYLSKTVEVVGDDNFVSKGAKDVCILGDNNDVYDSENIKIINGQDNEILSGLKNVTLINSNGLIIDESYKTYINGIDMSVVISEAKMKLITTRDSIHLDDYEFKPSEKLVQINDKYDTIQYIINATDGTIIYNPTDPDLKGVDDGSSVLLNYDTTTMSATDKLIVVAEVKDANREESYQEISKIKGELQQINKLLNETIN